MSNAYKTLVVVLQQQWNGPSLHAHIYAGDNASRLWLLSFKSIHMQRTNLQNYGY